MAQQCDFCGKRKMFGHNVSHANNKTLRVFNLNLRKVRYRKAGNWTTRKICSRCLKANLHLKEAA